MKTKMKQIALPLVVVIAVLLAFSSPAAAEGIGGYAGNHPLKIYEHDAINGGLVFETVTDGSMYKQLFCTVYRRIDPGCGQPSENWLSQTQTIEIAGIPDGATIKMARLYNYYCWSTSNNDNPNNLGLPAEADMWLTNDTETQKRVCVHGYKEWPINERYLIPNPIDYGNGVIHYWDTKGQNYTYDDWDFPSGVFAWDVTDMVTGNGIYTAKITNNDATPTGVRTGEPILSSKRERFVTFGFGLLVVYEKESMPEIEYWIAEGCDYLMNRTGFETAENATTSATFGGVSGATDANLTTVWTHTEGGKADPPQNMMYFNGDEIGPSLGTNINSIDVTYIDVTTVSDQNVLEFQDRDDDSCVHNAFLVVECEADTTPPEISVTVSPDTLWPPNHKMVDIVATVTVSDDSDPDPCVILASVTSSEPDDAKGNGDGNTVNDIQGADIDTEDYEFQLRAERAGKGDGRVYTITYTATDASGNSASASATVVVPHDMGS